MKVYKYILNCFYNHSPKVRMYLCYTNQASNDFGLDTSGLKQ